MRIAVVTTVHPALDGRIFHKEAVSLAKAGHAVTLFAPWHQDAAATAARHGLAYTPLGAAGSRASRPLRWLRLARALRRSAYDVWHVHDPELLPLAILLRALLARRVCLVYDLHEDTPKDILDKEWIVSWLRRPIARIAEAIERWGIGRCALVVAATDSIAKRVAEAAPSCVTTRNYPLAAAPRRGRRAARRGRALRVIYAGALTETRGVREMLRAMEELRDRPVELMLLGRFCPEALEAEIRRSAGSNVVIHPEVPFDQVWRRLQSSDIGILCLKPTAAFLQSLPIKLWEYMQAGLPVIASDFPLWRRIVEEAGCGIVVDPSQPAGIAAAIRRLADDPEARRRMGRAGRRAVAEFTWEREAAALLAAYGDLATQEAMRRRHGLRPSSGLAELERVLAARRAARRGGVREA